MQGSRWRGKLAELREQAGLRRGLLLCAPVLWAAYTVFLHVPSGLAGFCVHAFLCLPRRFPHRLILCLGYPLLSLWFAFRHPELSSPGIPFHAAPAAGGFRQYAGMVENFPVSNARGSSFPLRTEAGLFRAILPDSLPPPRYGALVILLASAETPESPPNPGQLNPVLLLRSQGALGTLRAEGMAEIRPPPRWKSSLARMRLELGACLKRHIPDPARPLVAGTLLNDTEDIPEETRQAFLRTGMQHIIAISGQHIALIGAFLLFFALWIRLPRKAALLCAAAATTVYIPLVGAPVSAVRAGIMMACALPALLRERPSSGLNVFCLSLAVDLLLHPFYVLNLGFQLSYAATLALIACSRSSRAVSDRFGSMRPIGAGMQMVFLSAMVTLFTFPALASSTHALSPWSIIGNVVTVPISSAMLLGGIVTCALGPWPWLAHAAGACTGFCSLLLDGSVHFLAGLPGALWSIAHPSGIWMGIFAGGVALLVALFRLGAWRLGFIGMAALAGAEISRPAWSRILESGPRVTMLSVGHGDAAVLELPGAVFLVDAGPTPRTAKHILIPFLRSRGIRRVDALLLTHPDLDHYGGAAGLLGEISIASIIVPPRKPGGDSGKALWNCLRSEAQRLGIPWREGRAGDWLYRRRNLSLALLGPDSTLDSASDNDRSLVCLLSTPAKKVLFTGDVEGPGQRALASSWPLWRGALLKAPHHGSDRTTLPCFLQAARPTQAAISSGRRPGFPGSATMATLRELGTGVAVTARDGAVVWKIPTVARIDGF